MMSSQSRPVRLLIVAIATVASVSAAAAQTRNAYWLNGPGSETVVIFVHGIFSNSQAAWTADNKTFWPGLVSTDDRMKGTDVFLGGYDSTPFAGTQWRIRDAAIQLLTELSLPEERSQKRVIDAKNIFFIAHSMGGIVVREALLTKPDMFEGKNLGLFLVSSPARGSALAAMTKHLNFPHAQLAELQKNNSPYLDELHARFTKLVDDRPNMVGREIVETQGLLGIFRLSLLTPVTANDLGGYFGEAERIPGMNHSEIAKPRDKDSPQHKTLVVFWKSFTDLIKGAVKSGKPAVVSKIAPIVCPDGKASGLVWNNGSYSGPLCKGLPHGANGVWEKEIAGAGKLRYVGSFKRGTADGNGKMSLETAKASERQWISGSFVDGRFIEGEGDIVFAPRNCRFTNDGKPAGRYVGDVLGRAFIPDELGRSSRSFAAPHGRGNFRIEAAPKAQESTKDDRILGFPDVEKALRPKPKCDNTGVWEYGVPVSGANVKPQATSSEKLRLVIDDWTRLNFQVANHEKLKDLPCGAVFPQKWAEDEDNCIYVRQNVGSNVGSGKPN